MPDNNYYKSLSTPRMRAATKEDYLREQLAKAPRISNSRYTVPGLFGQDPLELKASNPAAYAPDEKSPVSFWERLKQQPLNRVKQFADKFLGDPADTGNLNPAVTVFHGTGANPFRNFDKRFMSTGEGNQMFGYGHYLTDSFPTAKHYFDITKRRIVGGVRPRGTDLTPQEFYDKISRYYNGLPFKESPDTKTSALGKLFFHKDFNANPTTFGRPEIQKAAIQSVQDSKNIAEDYLAIDPTIKSGYFGSQIEPRSLAEGSRKFKRAVDHSRMFSGWQKMLEDIPSSEQGGIFKVELPDEVVNNQFLQWDRQLREQPEGVLKGLGSMLGRRSSEARHLQSTIDALNNNLRTAKSLSPNSSIIPILEERIKDASQKILTAPKMSYLQELQKPGYGDIFYPTGSQIYRGYNPTGDLEDAGRSASFLEAGIPGHRFLRGGRSRIQKQYQPGDFNYVSYDDNLPQLLEYFTPQHIREAGDSVPKKGIDLSTYFK